MSRRMVILVWGMLMVANISSVVSLISSTRNNRELINLNLSLLHSLQQCGGKAASY